MKKHLLSFFFTLALLVPVALQAQTPEAGKGKHGGFIVGGEQQVYFEIVDDGTKITFYPCDKSGDILKVVPTVADLSVVYLLTTEQYQQKSVELNSGAFTMVPPRDYPVYMYSISYDFNGQHNAVKFRKPGSPQPR